MKQIDKDIHIIKNVLKVINREGGTRMCKSYNPNCPNCQFQIFRGHILDFLDLLEEERQMQ